MQLTRQSEYAVRTMLELASRPFGEIIPSKIISESQDIPEDFLKKTIQLLTLSGLLSTQRVTQGGVRLVKPPDQITIADIVTAIEGTVTINPCLAPGYVCSRRDTCPVSPILARAQNAMLQELSKETLADLVENKP